MINLFDFAPSDASLVYLASIFGTMNNIIPAPEGGNILFGNTSIIGAMFKVFNSTVLAVGALVVLYVTVMSVVMTAHEGEFMGKKWNNIWIFIRIVFAIALMIPSQAGYSAIQYIFMWIIVQGIGAADVIWNSALDYVNQYGSIYAQPTVPTVGTSTSLSGLFQALVCEQSARWSQADPSETEGGNYFCAANRGNPFCGSPLPRAVAGQNVMSFGPNGGSGVDTGTCGALSYCNTTTTCAGAEANSLACKVCQAQIGALNSTITALNTAAQRFVEADYTYRVFYHNSARATDSSQWGYISTYCSRNGISPEACCISPVTEAGRAQEGVTCALNSTFVGFPVNENQMPQNLGTATVKGLVLPYAFESLGGEDFIATLTNQHYTTILENAVSDWYRAQANQSPAGNDPITRARNTGWIMAGSFYYAIAQQNNTQVRGASPPLNFAPAFELNTTSSVMYSYRNNFDAAGALAHSVSNKAPSTFSSSPQISSSMDALSSASNDAGAAFDQNLESQLGTNPISRLQSWGMICIRVAEITFVVLLAGSLIAGLFGNMGDIFFIGTGMINPLGPALTLVFMVLVPLMFAFLGILVVYGGLLAVYTPLIPYVIFTVAAISWFISVVEAMVAGPLVALGMLSPNAQGHEILGKSEAAIGHIFSIFLRPTLMVFGLIAAMLVATAVVAMIDAGFYQVKDSTGAGWDPLASILFFGAYIGLVISALNKSFALIYIVPQQALSWMGLHHQGVGGGVEPGEALQGAKAGQEQMGGYAGKGMEGMPGGGKEAMGAAKEQYKKRAAKEGAKGGNITGSTDAET